MTTPERNSDPISEPSFVASSTISAPPPPHPSAGPASASSALGWLGVAAVIAFVAVGQCFAFKLDRAGGVSFWLFAIVPSVLVAVVALVRAARDGELGELVQPAWGDATRGLMSAGILVGAAMAFVHVFAPAGSARESWMARLYLQLGDPRWLRTHNGLVAVTVLVAAAAEEVVWRGLVTRLIAEKVGSRTAWAWASLPYALAQLPTVYLLRDPEAGLNPVLVLAALALGLVWGGLARSSRRLAPSVLSHAAFLWCVIVMFRLWGGWA